MTNPNPPQGDAAALTAPEETPAAQVQRFRINDYCANSNLVLTSDGFDNQVGIVHVGRSPTGETE